eukprot:CAMPEP_0206481042 /NCGR_PEP_ID=MMETSP0324_2-20121206/37851_1 /ASSEMBLY_ACC=CAM_ASM_000836 /TAXON_ID=2866 /ORGANISM="Crypthecodinium cohnii, Strain Seligo" /LENGTH=141 /DNA_ID=CAMNT_0053958339 /DNA_START=96 /DNA_END=521 /DNA_ORIENTATION=-
MTDFTGRWKLVKVEGEADTFLSEMGLGWAMRKMIGAMGYGVGKMIQDIKMSDSEITISIEGVPKTSVQSLKFGESDQETNTPDGGTIFATLQWDGPALVMTAKRTKDGPQLPQQRRYLEGDMMILEGTTSKGPFKRIFAKE